VNVALVLVAVAVIVVAVAVAAAVVVVVVIVVVILEDGVEDGSVCRFPVVAATVALVNFTVALAFCISCEAVDILIVTVRDGI